MEWITTEPNIVYSTTTKIVLSKDACGYGGTHCVQMVPGDTANRYSNRCIKCGLTINK